MRLTGAFFLLLCSLAAQTPSSDPPAKVVRDFYSAYQKMHFSGLPNPAQVQTLAPYFSKSLQEAIKHAQAEQDRCAKAHPDEKGPWVEGDLFSSTFEGFTSFRVDEPAPSKSSRQNIKVSFEYVDGGQKHPWADQVVVVKQGTRWAIEDVRYGGGQPFGNGFGRSLLKSLKGKGC